MASTQTGQCPHGFPTGQCLICQTLTGGGAAVGRAGSSPPAVATQAAKPAKPAKRRRRSQDAAPVPAPAPARRSLVPSALAVIVVAIVALVAFWWVWHLAWAVIHIIEFAAIGLACGWAGWKLGVGHGRRLERRGR